MVSGAPILQVLLIHSRYLLAIKWLSGYRLGNWGKRRSNLEGKDDERGVFDGGQEFGYLRNFNLDIPIKM